MSKSEDRAVVRRYWSTAVAGFDDQPDHGLQDPRVRSAWRTRLEEWVSPQGASVVDFGCGTGSVSVLLAELGHRVFGVDVSPAMIELARAKATAAWLPVDFSVGDVEHPPFPPDSFDVVLCRHVAWTLFDPPGTLERWATLLAPGGRMVLIEGRWFDPSGAAYPGDTSLQLPWNGGVSAETLAGTVEPWFDAVHVIDLSKSPELWGRPVTDERYAVVALQST